ncbi:MAG TPA: hypothetical protein VF583_05750 [Bradyrhizobium sp.]
MEQYKFDHPFFRPLRWFARISMVAGAFILCFSIPAHLKYVGLGMLFLASGVVFIHAHRQAVLRRYLVNPDVYRTPRYLEFSNYILWNRTKLRWVNALAGFLAFAASYIAFGFWLGLLFSIVASWSAFLASAAIKMLVKRHVDTLFRIVVFRRNARVFARSHIAEVMPVCGTYGQILLLTDETLATTWEGGLARMDNWVLGETYMPLMANPRSHEDWKEVIATQLSFADFVVFDWPGEITENMLWELHQTIQRFPLERMMMLVSHDNREDVDRMLRNLLQVDQLPDSLIAISPTERMLTLIFMRKFEWAMNSLVRTPRSGPETTPALQIAPTPSFSETPRTPLGRRRP